MRFVPGAVAAVLLLSALLAFVPGAGATPAASTGSTPITGNVTGPSIVSTSSNGTFYLNATGGPAVVSGIFAGTINWTATLSGANTTGSSVTPDNGSITNSTSQPVKLTLTSGAIAETLTLTVKVTSALAGQNKTGNFSKTFRLVPPYTVRATLEVGADAGTLPFNVTVELDGAVVATVTVPKLAPNATYDLVYRYPSTGLSSGYHTFTLVLADPHGLVTFANGETVQSTTFYIAPAAPNNTVWYVVGVVAFFGVLFIYATRGAARRRGAARK